MSLSKDTEAWIALNLMPGLGPVRTRKLLEKFGTPRAILNAGVSQLETVEGVGSALAREIARWQDSIDPTEELELATDFGASILHWQSESYPKALREIHAPPVVLYVWGELIERDNHAIGVVGSRRSTNYGNECAKKLSYQLAYAGLTVVSGLARGIDTAAHQGALAARGRTVACLGGGLMELYPPENAELARRIAGSGAVVSEFPMRCKPDRQTFPMRNRIVSGWGFGVMVVEAPLKSGAMITATQAAEQGRSVYAVPGPIDRPMSQGCNRLIQQGARLVMDAGDVLDELGMLFPDKDAPRLPAATERPAPVAELSDNERRIYAALGSEERQIDTLIQLTGLPSGDVLSALMNLELKHCARQLPGKRFVRIG